jgi:hemerythrin
MSPIQWTQALAVGVPEIDAQHQELFRRAEREERYMHEIGFPGLEAQRSAHNAFRDEFAMMVTEFERKGPTPLVALRIHNWLSDWLRKHVGGMDVEIGRFAAQKHGV